MIKDKIITFGIYSFGVIVTLFYGGYGLNAEGLPKETYKALSIDEKASPKQLYDALTKRYYDPKQGFGEGSLAKFWEPIPITKYLAPGSFYKPPAQPEVEATRAQCVECHESTTPGWVHSWKSSVHSNLDDIRQLSDTDPKAYKKEIILEVENNLRSMGKLAEGEKACRGWLY